jgi:hypothetical protein
VPMWLSTRDFTRLQVYIRESLRLRHRPEPYRWCASSRIPWPAAMVSKSIRHRYKAVRRECQA